MYQFRRLSTSDGLSDNNANCIEIDSDGYLWIGTLSGLNRFDGFKIDNYSNKFGRIQSISTLRIQPESDKNKEFLWVGTKGLRIFNLQNKTYEYPGGNVEPLSDVSFLEHFTLSDSMFCITSGNETYVVIHSGKNIKHVVKGADIEGLKHLKSRKIKGAVIDKFGQIIVALNTSLYLLKTPYENGEPALSAVKITSQKLNNRIRALHIDKDSNLVAGVNLGLVYFTPGFNGRNEFTQYTPYKLNFSKFSSKQIIGDITDITYRFTVNNIVSDSENNYWLGTVFGIFKLTNPHSSNPVLSKINGVNSLALSPSISSLREIKITEDYLILTNRPKGVDIYNLKKSGFYASQYNNDLQLLKDITALHTLPNGKILIGTNLNGLFLYDERNIERSLQPINPKIFSVVDITSDLNNKVWAARNSVLYLFDEELKTSTQYPVIKFNNIEHPLSGIKSITCDNFNRIWINLQTGGLVYIEHNQYSNLKLQPFSFDGDMDWNKSIKQINYVFSDTSNNCLWICTSDGLSNIRFNNVGKVIGVKHFLTKQNNKLRNKSIRYITKQNDTVFWISAVNRKLAKLSFCKDYWNSANCEPKVRIYNIENNNPTNRIIHIATDDNERVWLSGNGISIFDPGIGTLKTFNHHDGVQHGEFNKTNALTKDVNGKFYFGGTEGFTRFNPHEIRLDPEHKIVKITGLEVNDIAILPKIKYKGQIILSDEISSVQEVKLRYDQNNVKIYFSNFDLPNSSPQGFKYRLIGKSSKWKIPRYANNYAVLENLTAGEYQFEVTAGNNTPEDNIATLQIKIYAPWWLTWWAYIAYFLGFSLFFYLFWINREIKHKLRIRQIHEKRAEEIHQAKIRFFTNVSHEFRMPLTLIKGPIDQIIETGFNLNIIKSVVPIIQRNATQLEELINEIMDFRRTETQNFVTNFKWDDIGTYTQELFKVFELEARSRSINYQLHMDSDIPKIYADKRIYNRLLSNIISNAFKYTDDNGEIKVKVSTKKPARNNSLNNYYSINNINNEDKILIYVLVEDTGIGISKEFIDKIFDRFFEISDKNGGRNLGMGIGLALVKSMVNLHKANLKVESGENVGTRFTIGLSEKPEGEVVEETNDTDLKVVKEIADSVETKPTTNQTSQVNVKRKILLIDDNKDILFFIKNGLSDKYDFISANNGKKGIELVHKHMPELIVSDIMMPYVNGHDLCKTIKENKNTSHIPIILLTAQATDEHAIEGFSTGADMYVTKPFNLSVLSSRIDAVLRNRDAIKESFRVELINELDIKNVNKTDEAFLKEVIALIKENISIENFSLGQNYERLGMSRASFFQKIKVLTGFTPNELVMNTRLSYAASLLRDKRRSASQVAYDLGFSSPSYFTKKFKEKFGVVPSEFVGN